MRSKKLRNPSLPYTENLRLAINAGFLLPFDFF